MISDKGKRLVRNLKDTVANYYDGYGSQNITIHQMNFVEEELIKYIEKLEDLVQTEHSLTEIKDE